MAMGNLDRLREIRILLLMFFVQETLIYKFLESLSLSTDKSMKSS